MARVYVTLSPRAADVRVRRIETPSDADLLACLVPAMNKAKGDTLWRYVSRRTDATVRVCFVDEPNEADLVVCFVESPADAGWKRMHRLQGRLA